MLFWIFIFLGILISTLDYTAEILEATEDACGDLFHAKFHADSESGLKFDLWGRS